MVESEIPEKPTDLIPPQRKLRAWENALSGATAGVVCHLVIAPLDVIKIRFQLQEHSVIRQSNKALLCRPTDKPKYIRLADAAKTIMKDEGWRAFWKGNLAAEYLYLTYSAIQFLSYHELQKRAQEKLSPTSFVQWSAPIQFLCGAIAGILATSISYPYDVIRTRLAAQEDISNRVYKNITHAIVKMYREEGILGFYRGLWPSLLQIGPYMDRRLAASTMENLICGGIAGALSKTAVLPLDTLRKRLQMQGAPHLHTRRPMKGVIDGAQKIWIHEGVLGFYKGWAATMLKVTPASAVTFLMFEKTKQLLLTWRPDD